MKPVGSVDILSSTWRRQWRLSLYLEQLRRNSLVAMAEVGLVRFAEVAWDVAKTAVLRYLYRL
jgi:hypothetical protein